MITMSQEECVLLSYPYFIQLIAAVGVSTVFFLYVFDTNPGKRIPEWSGKFEWASGRRGCGWGSLEDCHQKTVSDLKKRGSGWCGAGWTAL